MPNGECRYFLTDQVDSVNVVLNDKGDAVTRTEYKPYGDTWIQEGDRSNRPKFNSQELDPETGYYFYNARYYEAEIGRFITADNIIPDEYSTQSWNRFSYCKGNPIKYKDPTGHAPIQDDKTQKIVSSVIDVSKFEDLKELGNSKERDLTVESTIESNIRNSSGSIIGMKGKQKITYIKSDGNKIEQTIDNVIWKEDADVENSRYPYEMPASPEDGFEIRKNTYENSRVRYPILTTHSETGIMVHANGRSEGCFMFDTTKVEGDEALSDLHNRTVNQGEVLRGRVTCVTDKRTAAERRVAPVYYLNDPNYIIENTGE